MKIRINKLLRNGKTLFLAYDQGLELGPTEFNDKNVDPLYIIKIAKEGKYNGLIVQKGIAQKYLKEIKESKVPLIVKLNGKANIRKGEPLSTQLCTVEEARELGASAVGFTIYLGSQFESLMLKEFESIQAEAHKHGLPVIAWIYPRGKSIKGRSSKDLLAYACRVGLEIGADIIKVKSEGCNLLELKWAIKSAGRTKVVLAGGAKINEAGFLKGVSQALKAGACGIAVGRNVWKSKDPAKLSKSLKDLVFGK